MKSGTMTFNYHYFDVLPIRFQPEYLESCTSYLTRLAERNGVPSVDGLAALCFPHQDRRITRALADYPPTSFETLMRSGTCSGPSLSGTTFFHLGMKFGRTPKPQPLSRFLAGSIASHLRFCPLCLSGQTRPYYSLLWRFITLKSCPVHSCTLLDRCGKCGNTLSLLTAPLKIGMCSFCRFELKMLHSEPTPEEEILSSLVHAQDLEFLLSPLLSTEIDFDNIAKAIGLRFKYERKARKFTSAEIANRIGVTLSEVEGIERGNILRRGAKFQSYLKYAKCLDITLRSIFSGVLQEISGEFISDMTSVMYPTCPKCNQSRFVIKFGHNHSGSQRYRCRSCCRYFT